jgi:hypothetical protein
MIMKKMTFLACAAMLTSTVVLTGCKGEGQNEPGKKAPEITANISVALPTQVSGMKRMPSQTVQENGADDFEANGMLTNIVLVPFDKKALTNNEVTASSNRLGGNITLGAATKTVDPDSKSKAQLYTGKVPVGTTAFLFYAKSANSMSDNFKKGALNYVYASQTPADFEFSLQPIAAQVSEVQDAKGNALLTYLNAIAQASDGTTQWRNYTDAINEGYTDMFAAFSSLKTLTSYGVQRMVTDLYQSVMNNTDDLAQDIKTKIATGNTVATDGKVTLSAALSGYPASVNMPEGAVAIKYNTTADPSDAEYHTFVYADPQTYGPTGTQLSASILRYTYPAELWYRTNTLISTSNTSEAEHYVDAASWSSILGNYTAAKSVSTATRSIALDEIIEYAVARLDVHLMAAASLNDNNPIAGERAIVNNNGYQLTGVLVGGQKSVGWDFAPKGSVEYVIYDREMPTEEKTVKATTGTYSTNFNSTLVLETAPNEDVLIAVELLNNSGKDFFGVDGIVPAGGKFYLVGRLRAALAIETGLNNRVFVQDHTTVANLTIGSLEKAYNVIPDLRTPQLEIGLSVNLEWKDGHVYEVTL